MLFWHLNLVDKGLALIFGRPPTFHKSSTVEMEMPSLYQLMRFQPHIHDAENRPDRFGAHYLHQMMQLSLLLEDIWTLLYGNAVLDLSKREIAVERLQLWYREAMTVSIFLSSPNIYS